MRRKLPVAALIVAGSCVLVLALGRGSGPGVAQAASHREAPLISLDAPADISDFFMFRSYEPGHEGNVVLIMDTNPGEEPSSGPNYYNFDPNVTYRFRIDNNQDGKPNDVIFEFKFEFVWSRVSENLAYLRESQPHARFIELHHHAGRPVRLG